MGNAFLKKGVCQKHPKGGGCKKWRENSNTNVYFIFWGGGGCRITWELFFATYTRTATISVKFFLSYIVF